ncbi:MAG: hypothetical protein OXH93_09825, partial [Caldilineaceae bacterium]|nr:hypothetical protein [Caldilineaceae bacterium]
AISEQESDSVSVVFLRSAYQTSEPALVTCQHALNALEQDRKKLNLRMVGMRVKMHVRRELAFLPVSLIAGSNRHHLFALTIG